MNTAYLKHYGVKGMKWGVRKEREKTGRRSSKEKKPSRRKVLKELRKKNGYPLNERIVDATAAITTTYMALYFANKAIKATPRFVESGKTIVSELMKAYKNRPITTMTDQYGNVMDILRG